MEATIKRKRTPDAGQIISGGEIQYPSLKVRDETLYDRYRADGDLQLYANAFILAVREGKDGPKAHDVAYELVSRRKQDARIQADEFIGEAKESGSCLDDLKWVYANLRVRNPKLDSCPSSGAFALLKLARSNPEVERQIIDKVLKLAELEATAKVKVNAPEPSAEQTRAELEALKKS